MSSSDDEIGIQAEQEYVESLPKKKSHSKGLPASERARIIANAMNQQEDPYYKAYNKNGKWYVRKRKVPLDIPPSNSSAVIDVGENLPGPKIEEHIEEQPNEQTQEQPQEKPKNEWKQQFFSMQNTINEDLKNTLNKVCERCDKIEKKYMKLKREKAKRKIEKEKNIKREEVKFEDEEPQEQEHVEEQEPEMTKEEFLTYVRRLPPFKRGKFLNINEF